MTRVMGTSILLVGMLLIDRPSGIAAQGSSAAAPQRFDLAERLTAATLRAVNRSVAPLQANPGGVHLTEAEGNGVAWLEGTDFARGTIEVDVRGRDVQQRSFVGVAFHRQNDNTYEAVYLRPLRPFNFRNADVARRQNAVQYISLPDYDWPRLRKEFPSEFENPVDASVVPTEWVPLRVVVTGNMVQIYVGKVASPSLEVRKLGSLERGAVGLWVGNTSDGDFANLRLTPMK
jgi:hypothetical protein